MTTTNISIPENQETNKKDVFIFPTSFAQKRIWFFEQIEPGNYAYNNYAAIKLTGKLNRIALEQTLNEIVNRHESLRTKFGIVKEEAVQIVLPSLNLKLPFTDLQTIPENQKQAKVKQLIEQEITQPFDLKQLPLIKFSLLQLGQNQHILINVIHHIISDGWLAKVMMEEMATLYTAFSQNKPSPLPDLPIQYADYTIYQQKYLQGNVLEKLLKYWQQQLKDLPVLELPTDKPRPPVETYRGATQTLILPQQLSKAIKTLSQQQNVTLFMTLLAAFKILLLRYTQQTDIAVGTPIANRNSTQTENLIGVFINTLVLRTNLSDNPTFLELLTQVREVALGAYAHQEMPFEKLVEVLQPERDLGRSPLFQVMFVFQNHPISTTKLPGLTLEPIPIANKTSKFDLSLYMEEVSPEKPSMLEHSMRASNQTGGGMIAVFEYNTDIFAAETMRRMTEHFQTLLAGIVANPNQPISELPMLTTTEQQQLLEWNKTEVDYPKTTLNQIFEAQVEKTPDAVAVEFEGEQLTYQQLNQQANQLAHYLQTLGVRPDVKVGICLERSVEMVIGLLGILKAGGAYIPIDPNYPPERISLMLSDSVASVLLTQENLAATIPPNQAQVLYLDTGEILTNQSSENPVSNINSEHLAYVIYTSGSTGKPKGVQIPHRAVVNFLLSMQQQPGITKDDILLAVTTISFDIAGLEIYLPLISGAKVVLASRTVTTDGTQLAKLISTSGATIMQATPATWQLLLASGWQGSESLKILCGGEALPTDLAQQLLSCSNSVWNLYGPTETTIWSTVCQLAASQPENTSIPIGRPIANTQIYILDHCQQPLPVGVPGELYIGGAGLAPGYLNRPELTAEKFI